MRLVGITHDVEVFCKSCNSRKVAKKKPHMKIEASSGHLVASKLFEVIAIDFTVLEKDSRGSKNLLIVYYRLLQ